MAWKTWFGKTELEMSVVEVYAAEKSLEYWQNF